MVQWVKALTTNPEDLSLIPRTNMVEEVNQFLIIVL